MRVRCGTRVSRFSRGDTGHRTSETTRPGPDRPSTTRDSSRVGGGALGASACRRRVPPPSRRPSTPPRPSRASTPLAVSSPLRARRHQCRDVKSRGGKRRCAAHPPEISRRCEAGRRDAPDKARHRRRAAWQRPRQGLLRQRQRSSPQRTSKGSAAAAPLSGACRCHSSLVDGRGRVEAGSEKNGGEGRMLPTSPSSCCCVRSTAATDLEHPCQRWESRRYSKHVQMPVGSGRRPSEHLGAEQVSMAEPSATARTARNRPGSGPEAAARVSRRGARPAVRRGEFPQCGSAVRITSSADHPQCGW